MVGMAEAAGESMPQTRRTGKAILEGVVHVFKEGPSYTYLHRAAYFTANMAHSLDECKVACMENPSCKARHV